MLNTGRAAVDIAFCGQAIELADNWHQSLRYHGYATFDSIASESELRVRLGERAYDLLLLDAELSGDPFQTLKEIRRAEIGQNPFVVAMMTGTDSAGAVVEQGINSGIDDFVRASANGGTIFDRIQTQVTHRKPFVVTSDFIGPERRQDQERETSNGRFVPPNTLQLKEQKKSVDLSIIQQAIDDATRQLHHQRARKLTLSIGFLVRLSKQISTEPTKLASLISNFAQIETMLAETARCLEAVEADDIVTKLCLAVAAACTSVRSKLTDAKSIDWSLMSHLTMALIGSVHNEEHINALETKINSALDRYNKKKSGA